MSPRARRPAWAALGALLQSAVFLCLLVPSAEPRESARALGGLWVESASWNGAGRPDARGGDEELSQAVAGLWTEVALGQGFEARAEVSAVRGRGLASTFDIEEGISGALLLRYEPRGKSWLVHAGAALPAGPRDLTAGERELIRRFAEPALGFPDPDPVRGWRFHLGAMAGHALSHRLSLYGGAGCELATSYEPAEGVLLDPGNRISGLVGLEGRRDHFCGGVQLAVSFEGQEEAGGRLIRGRRSHIGFRCSGCGRWGGLNLGLSGRLATSGTVEWPAADSYELLEEDGPGRLGAAALSVAPVEPFGFAGPLRLRPSLVASYRRFLPEGLPYGDGWAAAVTPELRLFGNGPQIALAVGWQWGQWRPWYKGSCRGPSDLSGMRVTVRLLWQPASADGGKIMEATRL